MEKSLLIGCGNDRTKKVCIKREFKWTGELVTLDMNPNCNPTIVWNLENRPLPFPSEEFDEIAAYNVLEHVGRQGDWRGWFDEMAEYHRILKPGGQFGILVPIYLDALADPGHSRFFHINYFYFLNQKNYELEISKTSMTDYRWYWKLNFDIVLVEQVGNHHLAVVLVRA